MILELTSLNMSLDRIAFLVLHNHYISSIILGSSHVEIWLLYTRKGKLLYIVYGIPYTNILCIYRGSSEGGLHVASSK